MSWFLLALLCVLGWGFADLFYKKSSDENDSFSHLKITIWVGFIMGLFSFVLLPFSETIYSNSIFSLSNFLKNIISYSPASISYIVSMIIGYIGLRYLELSIVSPIQNASGAFSMIAMLILFSILPGSNYTLNSFSIIDYIGTSLIVIGVILIAIFEHKISKNENENQKYRLGALALIFPLLYCLFDTIGTAADGIILDESSGLNLGEIDVIILYGFTFFLISIISWIFLSIKKRRVYNPFQICEIKTKGVAACCEEIGQVFYVYSMAKNPILVAPMVSSYCIVSMILSKLIIKEQLKKAQYFNIILVVIGIILLGISEGISEA